MRSTLLILSLMLGGLCSLPARDAKATREIEFLL
jgi:hypothetical protein